MTRSTPLGSVAAAEEFLHTCTAEGGGDVPEAVIDGLAEAVTAMRWRERSLRIVVLVGDAPPHGVGGLLDGLSGGCPCERTLEQVSELARQRSVRVLSVAIGGVLKLRPTFRAVAASTKGLYLTINQLESVTDHILALLNVETEALADEMAVLHGLASGKTPRAIAAAGREVALVMHTVRRLRQKGAIMPAPRAAPKPDAVASVPSPWWRGVPARVTTETSTRNDNQPPARSQDGARPKSAVWWRNQP